MIWKPQAICPLVTKWLLVPKCLALLAQLLVQPLAVQVRQPQVLLA
jgi:hypothetical protein